MASDARLPRAQALGNELWHALPEPIVACILGQLDPASFVAASCACVEWRALVLATVPELSPKSQEALPLLARCRCLRRVDLSATLPAPDGVAPALDVCLPGLAGLSALCLAPSATAVWHRRALHFPLQQLCLLARCTALACLDLSRQASLNEPGALLPLLALPRLRELGVSCVGVDCRLPRSAWDVLARLTGLQALDVSGCCLCHMDGREHAGHPRTAPAPLHLLASLTQLASLSLAEWHVPPSARGIAALSRLPGLRCVSLSGLLPGSSSPQLLALLSGTALCQAEQALAEQHLGGSDELPPQAAAFTAAAAAAPAAAAAAGEARQPGAAQAAWGALQELDLRAAQLSLGEAAWLALPGLSRLDLSCAGNRAYRGEGLAQLAGLRELLLRGLQQLDYCELASVLAACRQLSSLDLSGSTIILRAGSTTAVELEAGRYRPPVSLSRRRSSSGAFAEPSGSRRDACDTGDPAAAAARGEPPPTAPGSGGLRCLTMSECGLAFQGLAWASLAQLASTPAHPSLLLLDLLLRRGADALRRLRRLQWRHATPLLVANVLSALVPVAAGSLEELDLAGCMLPENVPPCWQGLAAATRLTRLDLSDAAFCRTSLQVSCGTNPTAALLQSLAGMRRLHSLGLRGWRFYFASLAPIAGLAGSLRELDLSQGRDLADAVLWSLSHLTGLTSLALAGATPSSGHIWLPLLHHFPALRHLDLSNARLPEQAVRGVAQLRGLTSLELRGAAPMNATSLQLLVRSGALRAVRRLSLTPEGCEQGSCQGGQRGSDRSTPGAELAHVACELARLQSLRSLSLGSGSGASYLRGCLPTWVDVR